MTLTKGQSHFCNWVTAYAADTAVIQSTKVFLLFALTADKEDGLGSVHEIAVHIDIVIEVHHHLGRMGGDVLK